MDSKMASLNDCVKLYVSTVPGLEFISVSECEEVFKVKAKKEERGRVSFETDMNCLEKLCDLRSVHHFWVEVSQTSFDWDGACGKEDILKGLELHADSLKWDKALCAYNMFKEKTLSSWKRIEPRPKDSQNREEESSNVKFRVTCSRNGDHNFTSMEAAKYIGSGVKNHFNWKVDLEHFDIEILTFVNDNQVTIAIKISNESKHSRNLSFFGPTTLRATTSFCLLKLAGIKKGDIVCDPLCGTASICLEGVNSFPFSFHLGGEIHSDGCQNAINNIDQFGKTGRDMHRNLAFPCNIVQWDACHLPMRNGLVDAIVSDLPFGKRIGYKGRNFALYPALLKEMGRVCKPKGKAVLLTQHKSAMNKSLAACNSIWKKQATFFINMGGLNVAIYVLKKLF